MQSPVNEIDNSLFEDDNKEQVSRTNRKFNHFCFETMPPPQCILKFVVLDITRFLRRIIVQ